MHYFLIQWDTDQTVSVIEEKLVTGSKTEGGKVIVKYGHKKYRGVVLRISEDKLWLESLKVTTTGKVMPQDKMPPPSTIMAEKSQLVTASKAKTTGLKSVKKKKNEELLSIVNKEAHSLPDAAHSIVLHDGSSKDESNAVKVQDENQNVAVACSVCSGFPQATAGNLLYLNQVVAYITAHHENDLRSTILKSTVNDEKQEMAAKELAEMGRCMSGYKVELSPGSGVYASKEFLSDLARDFYKKPKEMVRRLLRLLITPKQLASSSALSIRDDVRAAVQDWVQRHCSREKILTTSEYHRCINLMCGTLRYAMKSPTSTCTTKASKSKESMSKIATGHKSKTPLKTASVSSMETPSKEISSKDLDVTATSPNWSVHSINQEAPTGRMTVAKVLSFEGEDKNKEEFSLPHSSTSTQPAQKEEFNLPHLSTSTQPAHQTNIHTHHQHHGYDNNYFNYNPYHQYNYPPPPFHPGYMPPPWSMQQAPNNPVPPPTSLPEYQESSTLLPL